MNVQVGCLILIFKTTKLSTRCLDVVPVVCSIVNENSSFPVDTRISPMASSVLITWIHFISLHWVFPSISPSSSLALLNLKDATEGKRRLPLRFVSTHSVEAQVNDWESCGSKLFWYCKWVSWFLGLRISTDFIDGCYLCYGRNGIKANKIESWYSI